MMQPAVAVFDADLPTGLATIRSLGRAGIEVNAYHQSSTAMGRYSRYASSFRECPSIADSDVFVSWLTEELDRGRIELVAPTSDSIIFHAANAMARLDGRVDVGHPDPESSRDALLKHRFATALDRVGFPTPATAAPTSVEEAVRFADKVGYPLVAKPRCHPGVGVDRGMIFTTEEELRGGFAPFDGEAQGQHDSVLAIDPDIRWPLLQELVEVDELEVISVSGCLGRSGEVLALDHSKKVRLWPPKLGIGSLFIAEEPQPFTDHAVAAVQQILGSGIFEFEVLFDRASGRYWGIDLNPRGFGQMALDIARGNDLPLRWYQSVTGTSFASNPTPEVVTTQWQMALPLFADLGVELYRGENRRETLAALRRACGRSTVGATGDWRDPLPGLLLAKSMLRHPGGLVRPFLDRDESAG